MNAKSVISARWITATFIELYVFAVFYHCNLGLRELFWSHVWAASYFSLGVHAAKRVAWRKLVDGFPLSTYMISMLNQVVVLPLVMFAVLVFTPDITTYLESARSSTDVFSPHIFYRSFMHDTRLRHLSGLCERIRLCSGSVTGG
eukprot:GEMP01055156.1.p1 GENE.GEMP01055156.1~~GEMP01055156.1.p1  ORF type:complete len:156 (-),score=13.85 GEMP01055156.1:1069-1503(-)